MVIFKSEHWWYVVSRFKDNGRMTQKAEKWESASFHFCNVEYVVLHVHCPVDTLSLDIQLVYPNLSSLDNIPTIPCSIKLFMECQ